MKLYPPGSEFTARLPFLQKGTYDAPPCDLTPSSRRDCGHLQQGFGSRGRSGRWRRNQYLLFQVWPRMPGYPGIPPLPGHMALGKEQMAEFVQSVVKAIGTTGDARHKLGFAVGPFCFDMSDQETRQWIRDAFAVARENDVAVAMHIDDSMSWGRRKDLLSNPDNIETADWKQIPNTARSLALGAEADGVSAADVLQRACHRGRGERSRGAYRRGDQAGAGGR